MSVYPSGLTCKNYLYQSQTLKPSARRHIRWASIHFAQASSPCSTMHSSLSFLVSGQAQQIFFFGFDSWSDFTTAKPCFGWDPDKAKMEEASCRGTPPIVTSTRRIQSARKEWFWQNKKKENVSIESNKYAWDSMWTESNVLTKFSNQTNIFK